MQKSIRINILGRDYPLRVHEENVAFMREVAHTVDTRMRSFKAAHPEQSDLVVAVISALGLAEEVFIAREASNELVQMMDHEMRNMERVLSEALSETEP